MTKDQFIKELLPFSDKMYRLSFRFLSDSEMAKDIVQNVFLKLWSNRKKIDSIKNVEAFAIQMTKNACLDKIKLQKKNTELKNYHKVVKPEYDTKEYAVVIKTIIASLPELQQKIIQLRDIEGFSFEEISEILDLPLNNIRVSLSVARKKVREEFKKMYDYGL